MQEEEELNEFQQQETKFECFVRKTKTSLFFTYYSIISAKFTSIFFYIILITIEFIQISGMIILNLNFYDYFQEENSQNSRINTYYHKISFLTKAYRIFIGVYEYNSKIYYLFFLYFIFTSTVCHFLLFFFIKKNNFVVNEKSSCLYDLMLKVFLFYDVLMVTVFQIPLYVTLFSFFQCDSNDKLINIQTISCTSPFYYVNISFSSISIFLMTILGLLNTIFLNDNTPTNKIVWGNSFSYIRTVIYFEKIILALCFALKFQNQFLVKLILVLILAILHSGLRMFNFYFVILIVKYFTICYEFAILVLSAVGLINYQYDSLELSFSTFFTEFFSGIAFGIFFILLLEKIKDNFLFLSPRFFSKESFAYFQLVALVYLAKRSTDKDIKDTIFISVLQKHRLKCFDQKCQCGAYMKYLLQYYDSNKKKHLMSFKALKFDLIRRASIIGLPEKKPSHAPITQNIESRPHQPFRKTTYTFYSDILGEESEVDENLQFLFNLEAEEEKLNVRKILFGVIIIILEQALNINPKSSKLRKLLAYIMMFYLDNIYKSIYELMKIPFNTQKTIIQYEMYIYKMEIAKKMKMENNSKESHSSLSMETILIFNNLTNRILDLISKTSNNVINFWEEILNFSIDDTKQSKKRRGNQVAYKYAVIISRNMSKMNSIFQRLKKNENFLNKIVYQLYAEFLSKVICNEDQAREIIKLLKKNEQNFQDLYNHKDNILFFKNGKINMDEIGTCVISGDLMHLGKIMHCNLQFGNIFKYEKEYLKKERINKLCPSYIAERHNEFILRYLETGKKHILGKNKLVFGLRSDGLLEPVIVLVKVVPNLEQSIRFIGLTKKMSKNHPFWGLPPNFMFATKDSISGRSEEENPFIDGKEWKMVSYILTNINGQVFGITKNALKLFGIPLNVLIGEGESGPIKEGENELKKLDIRKIIINLSFENCNAMRHLKTEFGNEMIIDTSILRNFFNDFYETLQVSKSPLLKVLKSFNAAVAFSKQNVQIKLTEMLFNDSSLQIKIFKIIKLNNNVQIRRSTFNKLNKNLRKKGSIFSVERTSPNCLNTPKAHRGSINEIPQRKLSIQNVKSPQSANSLPTSKNGPNDIVPIKKTSQSTETQLPNTKNENAFKNKLKNSALPYQIKFFIITFVLFLLLVLIVGVSEYFMTEDCSVDLMDYINLFHKSNLRNFYLIQIIQYLRVIVLLDNKILDANIFNRDRITKKMREDLNLAASLNNDLQFYISTLDQDLNELFNLKNITTYVLNDEYEFEEDTEKLFFLINQLLIKAKYLINDEDNLTLPESMMVFYQNPNINPTQKPNPLLKEIQYVIENYEKGARTEIETSILMLMAKMKKKQTFGNSTVRNGICYIPFGLIVISLMIFLLLLGKITEYKINILKVFYVVNKKYGYEVIRTCYMFLEYTSNFTKYTKYDFDVVVKELSDKTKEKFIIETNNNANVGTETYNGTVGTDHLNSNSGLANMNSNANLNSNNTNDFNKYSSGSTLQRFKAEKSVFFWEREEREKKSKIDEKKLHEKVTKELENSKRELKKKIILIIVQIVFLCVAIIIYFSVLFGINLNFDNSIINTIDSISLFSQRGWTFTNFVYFYREMIISYVEEKKEIFDYYKSYSYHLESRMLLLVNRFNVSKRSRKILRKVIEKEKSYSTSEYCNLLKSYDYDFYNEYLVNCESFFAANNGLEDNIKIISSVIEAEHIDDVEFNYDNIVKYLNLNSSFINWSETYIFKGILDEMDTVIDGVDKYVSQNKIYNVICLAIFVTGIFVEFILYVLIWRFLNHMLIKDKAILSIIPNDAISYSQKVKNALINLNKY